MERAAWLIYGGAFKWNKVTSSRTTERAREHEGGGRVRGGRKGRRSELLFVLDALEIVENTNLRIDRDPPSLKRTFLDVLPFSFLFFLFVFFLLFIFIRSIKICYWLQSPIPRFSSVEIEIPSRRVVVLTGPCGKRAFNLTHFANEAVSRELRNALPVDDRAVSDLTHRSVLHYANASSIVIFIQFKPHVARLLKDTQIRGTVVAISTVPFWFSSLRGISWDSLVKGYSLDGFVFFLLGFLDFNLVF